MCEGATVLTPRCRLLTLTPYKPHGPIDGTMTPTYDAISVGYMQMSVACTREGRERGWCWDGATGA